MRPAPFIARWQMGPVVAGAWQARLVLDDESLFAGHYPGAPILPGTFLVEALFQVAGVALGSAPRLAEIVTARFHSPLHPGDEVVAHFTLSESSEGATLVELTANSRAKAAEVTLRISPAGPTEGPRALDSLAPRERGEAATRSVAGEGSSERLLDLPFILRALPHRAPALLVDSARVLETLGTSPVLIARKTIPVSEPRWASATSYPGILVAESFCQSCGLLRTATAPVTESRDGTKVPVVAKLAGLRFLGDVALGEELEHHVKLVVRTGEGAVFSGQTLVAGRVVLEVARVVAAMAPC